MTQSEIVGKIFFWVAFGTLVPWITRNFYVSYRSGAMRGLRAGTIGMSILLFFFFFVPWLGPTKGSLSGWDLLLIPRWDAALYSASLLAVLAFVLTTHRVVLLKVAAGIQGLACILIFVIMIQVNPVIKNATWYDFVPIASAFLLMINLLVLLLFIQQCELLEKQSKK